MSDVQQRSPGDNCEGGLRILRPVAAGASAAAAGNCCVDHPGVEATGECRVCRQPMCRVCSFSLPNELSVCPACAGKRDVAGMTPQRVVFVVLAGLFLLGFPAAWASVFVLGATAGGLLMTAAAVGGLFCSLASLEKHLKNPWYIWPLVGVHALYAVTWCVMCVAGAMTSR